MATLNGRDYGRRELLELVGDISQIARVKPYRLVEGFEDQLVAADVTTGAGLEFTVLPGRGMDIGSATYNGRALAWRSPVGNRHAAYYEPHGDAWLRTFGGGLLATCGLTWMGASCEDEGEALGLHGRASSLPASSVTCGGSWVGDDYELTISGTIREAVVFGDNIQLLRTIRTRLGAAHFTVEDVVENMGHRRAPHMVLYHINVGFPVLCERSRFVAPTMSVTPRDSDAQAGATEWGHVTSPTVGYAAQVFFHHMQPGRDGTVTAAVLNDAAVEGDPYGLYVRYRSEQLPCFTQWKMMDAGAYVLGMEPGNARVMGRNIERSEGRLQYLEPGETREYNLEIGVVTSAAQRDGLSAAAALQVT